MTEPAPYPAWVAYEPGLVPSLERMRTEGIEVLEEWFRWAEEWSMILRVYGEMTRTSALLEIGCGQGRIAFPLRYLLSKRGSYDGFDIDRQKIAFLEETFHRAHPNFTFQFVDVHNSFYNPAGALRGDTFRFPYADGSFDLIYAASVFTHMAPQVAANYFREAARVLKPAGRCIFSVFLLDHYRPGATRSLGFTHPRFNFDHAYGAFDQQEFAIANPKNPEEMTAYSQRLIERLAAEAGLKLRQPVVPGQWSGSTKTWVGAQELVILERATAPVTGRAATTAASQGRDMAHPAAGSAQASAPVHVSVVIPAYNAAGTLAQTLESLQAQTFGRWEAIVVDDGSTDGTAAVAAGFARRDARIRSISGPHQGVGAARNAGIASARHDWLFFLDADDCVEPVHLERLTGKLQAEPAWDAAYCGWARVGPEGTFQFPPERYVSGDLFPILTRTCLFTIHACVVRRALVEAVGGFDAALRTCEDWDLWQRIARAGARFGFVPGLVAPYRLTVHSASSHGLRMFQDGLTVIARGHDADPRVPAPHPDHAAGRHASERPELAYYRASWNAASMFLRDEPIQPLLELLGHEPPTMLDPAWIASIIFDAMRYETCQGPETWLALWLRLEARVVKLLQALEAQSKTPCLVSHSRIALEQLLLDHVADPRPLTVGSTHAVRIELTEPMRDVVPPASSQRLHCTVTLDGSPLGSLVLPVCDGLVPEAVLADAISAKFAWPIAGRYFERTLGRPFSAHDATGWTVFLQELWGCPDLPGEAFYQPGPASQAPGQRIADWAPIEVSAPLPELEAAGETLQVVPQVGGTTLGVIALPVRGHRVSSAELRAAISAQAGFELCRAAVREGLLGRPFAASPSTLRQRLSDAAQRRADRRNGASRVRGGMVLGRRRPDLFDASASRHARLPAATAREVAASAKACGEAIARSANGHKDAAVYYDPGFVQRDAAGMWPDPKAGQAPAASARTAPSRANAPDLPDTDLLPILMYHNVAPDGSSVANRYRITPAALEAQLRYLRDGGFYSVGLDAWAQAMRARRPLPGRAVCLTFDDGYRDFATYAWPLLQRYGFTATMFIVTGEVGRWNRWDRAYRDASPLMSWKDIRRLNAEGLELGSHTVTHRPLVSLPAKDIVQEAVRSRAALQRELGAPIHAMAYPYGIFDEVVEHLVGASGYLYGVTAAERAAELVERPLALPRLEVRGTDTLQDFARKLGAPHTVNQRAADAG